MKKVYLLFLLIGSIILSSCSNKEILFDPPNPGLTGDNLTQEKEEKNINAKFWFNYIPEQFHNYQGEIREDYGIFYLPAELEKEAIETKKDFIEDWWNEGEYIANELDKLWFISFSFYELISWELIESDEKTEVENLILNWEFYGKQDSLIAKNVIRKKHDLENRVVFEEKLDIWQYVCFYYIERLNKDYIVFFRWCGRVWKYTVDYIKDLPKEELLKQLPELENKLKEEVSNMEEDYIKKLLENYDIKKFAPVFYKYSYKDLYCIEANKKIYACHIIWNTEYGWEMPYNIMYFQDSKKIIDIENCFIFNEKDIVITDDTISFKCWEWGQQKYDFLWNKK